MLTHPGYFTAGVAETDPQVAAAIERERERQGEVIELIASENIVSRAVLQVQGSILTNKTVEGYPGRRYYDGVENIDTIERLAIDRACAVFGCRFANVQAHSGSQANQAVYQALLKPGDTILSMGLAAGGHLSHGAPANMSGRAYDVAHYGVRREDGLIDYDDVARLARDHAPRLLIAGGSAYPRVIDFALLRAIADSVGALLLVDMAHFAGLVAGGVHPSPMAHADVVTTTTYKSLRGARGGLILTDRPDLAKRIDSGLFPGVQGSPMLHALAAKAVCLGEALRPEFGSYARAVLSNARALAATLGDRGYDVVTGGTDTPLVLVDLRRRGLTGDIASASLDRAGLTCNKNVVPFDTEKPTVTSGLRLGASAATTRGMGEEAFREIGTLLADVLDGLRENRGENRAVEAAAQERVRALTRHFPIYPEPATA